MKKAFFLFLCVFIASIIYARENLAILPFTGGQGDEGEAIAELFSFNDQINAVFNPIPRTSITQAITREQGFQFTSGMTDADTIVAIGRQLGARYVVAGSIASVGANKLLIFTIMDILNLQQIAGDYLVYTNMADIRRSLSNLAANLINATRKDTSGLPKLALVPVQLQGGANRQIADTLTQLLAIHLIRSGNYSVYPRTRSLEQVMEEHRIQFSGVTDDTQIIGVGYGQNPDLVLSVVARRFENTNMFNAAIINLLTGTQEVGRSVDYSDINDGMRVMENLSVLLTLTAEEVSQRQQREDMEQRARQEKEEKEEQRAAANRDSIAFFPLSGYYQWGVAGDLFNIIEYAGGSPIFAFYRSPIPYLSIGFDLRLGGLFQSFYYSVSPMVGFIFPINNSIKVFSNGILEIGNFGGIDGAIFNWLTPAFDMGVRFGRKWGADIYYRGTLYGDIWIWWERGRRVDKTYDFFYTHSIGLSFFFNFKELLK